MFLREMPAILMLLYVSGILAGPTTARDDDKKPKLDPVIQPIVASILNVAPSPLVRVINQINQLALSPSAPVPQVVSETIPTAANPNQRPTPSTRILPNSIASMTNSTPTNSIPVPSPSSITTNFESASPTASISENTTPLQNSTVIEVPPSNDTRKPAPWQQSGSVSSDQSQNATQNITSIIVGAIVGGLFLAVVIAGFSYYKRHYSQKKKVDPSLPTNTLQGTKQVQGASTGNRS